MIQIFDFEQCSPEWFEMRLGRLTASQYSKVLSSKSLKYAKLAKDPKKEAVHVSPRAKQQWTVLEQLADGDLETRHLNASGLKGLVERGVVSIYEDYKGCSLLKSAALSHIDGMLAEIYYKQDDLQPDIPSFAMERGVKLEEVARIDFEMRYGFEVEEVGFIVNSEIGDHIGASPDGIIDGGKGGLEIKCPLPATHLSYHRIGGLPNQYKAQVHGCMAVSGADYWWFYSFCPNIKEYALKVYRDDYTENLSKSLQEFNSLYEIRKNETVELQTQ